MTRRILIELLLFLTPFLIFFLYRAAANDLSVKDRWPLTTLVSVGGLLAVAGLLIKAATEPSDHGLCYQAGYYQDGVLYEGKKVPCDEVVVPESRGATEAARDPERENTEKPTTTARDDLPRVMEDGDGN